MAVQNISVCLKAHPIGMPDVDRDFEVKVEDFLPARKSGEMLLKNILMSVDPYLRGLISGGKGLYMEGIKIGQPMRNFCVAEVLESDDAGYPIGTKLSGSFPWSSYFTFAMTPEAKMFTHKIPSELGLPDSNFIGVLGMPGWTAYLGFTHLCQPKEGETLFVSAASGAVGQLVGQLAKMKGLRVVGCAGSDEKCDYLLKELKFDAAINYKKYEGAELAKAISEACPNGIDCNFENVGGEIFDAVLGLSNLHARHAICGWISQYNNNGEMRPINNIMAVIGKSIKLEGFVVSHLLMKYGIDEMLASVVPALQSGKIIYKEDIVEGSMSDAPSVFIRMLKGENFGKQILKLGN